MAIRGPVVVAYILYIVPSAPSSWIQPPVLALEEDKVKVVVAAEPMWASPTTPTSCEGVELATASVLLIVIAVVEAVVRVACPVIDRVNPVIVLSEVSVPSVAILPLEAVVVAKPLTKILAEVLEA